VPKFEAIITYDAVTRYHATVSVDADSEADALARAQVFIERGIVRPRYSALTSYSTLPEVEAVCLQNAP
jgi:hypothetical protein